MKKPHGKPNVILLSIDTLRADHLAIYGYSSDTAPNVSSLAEDGIVFENAYAAHTSSLGPSGSS